MITIAQISERVGSTNMYRTIELRHGKKWVVFEANFSSPDASDLSYSVHREVEIKEYRRGIERLKEMGKCTLKGKHSDGKTDAPDLVLLMNPSDRAISFMTEVFFNMDPLSFVTNWTANQITV